MELHRMRFCVSQCVSSILLVSLLTTSLANTGTNISSMHSKDAAHVTTHREQAIQEKTNPNDTERTKTQVRSLSPYDIASFITDNPQADLRQIWAQLGIKKLNLGGLGISEEEKSLQPD